MFKTVFTKTLRDNRFPILGFGCGLGLFLLNSFVSYATQVTDAAARQEIARLAEAFRFLGDPVALDTNEGLITWRIMSFLVPVILSIWAVRAGAGLVQNEEESGALDLLLANPLGRGRLLAEKILALWVSLTLAGLLFGACGAIGQAISGLPVTWGRVMLAGLNLSLLGSFFAMAALCLSQLWPARHVAAGGAGLLLVLSALADGVGRVVPQAVLLQRFSPFYYYNLNKPLIVSYPYHSGAVLLLAGLTAGAAVAAVVLFVRRDLGTGLTIRLPIVSSWSIGTGPVWSLRSVGLRAFQAQLPTLLGWLVGLMAYTGGAVLLMPAMQKSAGVVFEQVPVFEIFFPGVDFSSAAGFYSVIVIEFLPLIFPFFALALAMSWAQELDQRQTELVWGAPLPRIRFYLERLGALSVGLLGVPIAVGVTIQVCARVAGVDFSPAPHFITRSVLGLLPLEFVIAGLVYGLAGYFRASQVRLLTGGYLALAFLLVVINDYTPLPGWLMAGSIIHAYGLVMEHGYAWVSIYLPLMVVAVGLLGWGAVRFKQRDLGV